MNSFFVPSATDLLPACCEVLDEEKRPMHYKSVTEMAIVRLGYKTNDVNVYRAKEDVREKLPMRKDLDVAYVGEPHCLLARRSWFSKIQPSLFNADWIRIPGSLSAGVNGAYEALMRTQTMMNKRPDLSVSSLYKNRATGLVLQEHVVQWFKKNWPDFYREADNFQEWQKPCAHDFKLTVSGKTIKVDVAGVGASGQYKASKKTTDLHLQCKPFGDDVIWEGVVTGEMFELATAPVSALSPVNMVVWLNSIKFGVDYNFLASLI